MGQPLVEAGQADGVEQLAGPLPMQCARAAVHLHRQEHVGEHRPPRQQSRSLEHQGDVATGPGDAAPPMSTLPSVGGSNPAMRRSRVDFPQPERPMTARTRPRRPSGRCRQRLDLTRRVRRSWTPRQARSWPLPEVRRSPGPWQQQPLQGNDEVEQHHAINASRTIAANASGVSRSCPDSTMTAPSPWLGLPISATTAPTTASEIPSFSPTKTCGRAQGRRTLT